MGRVLTAFALMVAALAGAARAEEPVVVELFTSQGCSSCPPADALLARLTERPNIIPLALHVDYWDYIGWADSFANPAFTKRQKGYARANGTRTIYTPQMVVGGRSAVVGHKPMDLAEAIMEALELPESVRLDVTRHGDEIEVRVTAIRPLGGEALLQLVRYKPRETVAIDRGENAGRTFTYHNIVTDWQTMATWNGREPLSVRHPAPGDNPAVVLVQQAGYGPILAAARAR
jgi:hypothetical protein